MTKRFLLTSPLLAWWTPYWSHCGKSRREWRRLFNPGSISRIIFVATPCCLVVILGFRLAFPLLPVGRLWWLAIQLPGFLLVLYGMSWLYRAIPERVSVFDECLLVQHVDSARRIATSAISAAKVVIYSGEMARLRIWYEHKQKTRSEAFGLTSRIASSDLQSVLATRLSIVDARHRFREASNERNKVSGGNCCEERPPPAG